METKIIRKKIFESRENQKDRFKATYGDRNTFQMLRVEITRVKNGEMLVYEFNSSDLTDSNSIHFSTEILNGKLKVNWDHFISDKARLL